MLQKFNKLIILFTCLLGHFSFLVAMLRLSEGNKHAWIAEREQHRIFECKGTKNNMRFTKNKC